MLLSGPVRSDLCLSLQVGKGSVALTLSTLSFTHLWDEEKEEMDDLLMMGAMEPVVTEDLTVTREDIFRDFHPEGQ